MSTSTTIQGETTDAEYLAGLADAMTPLGIDAARLRAIAANLSAPAPQSTDGQGEWKATPGEPLPGVELCHENDNSGTASIVVDGVATDGHVDGHDGRIDPTGSSKYTRRRRTPLKNLDISALAAFAAKVRASRQSEQAKGGEVGELYREVGQACSNATPPAPDAPTPSPANSDAVVTDKLVTPKGNVIELFNSAGYDSDPGCWVQCRDRYGFVAADGQISKCTLTDFTSLGWAANKWPLTPAAITSLIQWADNLPAEPVVTPAPSGQGERVAFDVNTWPKGVTHVRRSTLRDAKHVVMYEGPPGIGIITGHRLDGTAVCRSPLYEELATEGWEYSTDGGNSWQPCTRTAPANQEASHV